MKAKDLYELRRLMGLARGPSRLSKRTRFLLGLPEIAALAMALFNPALHIYAAALFWILTTIACVACVVTILGSAFVLNNWETSGEEPERKDIVDALFIDPIYSSDDFHLSFFVTRAALIFAALCVIADWRLPLFHASTMVLVVARMMVTRIGFERRAKEVEEGIDTDYVMTYRI